MVVSVIALLVMFELECFWFKMRKQELQGGAKQASSSDTTVVTVSKSARLGGFGLTSQATNDLWDSSGIAYCDESPWA